MISWACSRSINSELGKHPTTNSRRSGNNSTRCEREHCAEEGILAEANDAKEGEKAKITAKSLKAALMKISKDAADADERAALETYAHMLEQQSEAKARRKVAMPLRTWPE